MAKWGSADFQQLKNLQKKLEHMETETDRFCSEAARELAARLLALVIPRTPVGKRPKLQGPKTEKVTGASGKSRSFLTAEGARIEQYWSGYMGGTLRRGWTAKTEAEAENGSGTPTAAQAAEYAQNLPVQKSGGNYIITVVNPVKYASYVEFGHRQTPARYVPALGKSLKADFVEGQYFLTLSEADLERVRESILQKKIKKFLQEVLGNG